MEMRGEGFQKKSDFKRGVLLGQGYIYMEIRGEISGKKKSS